MPDARYTHTTNLSPAFRRQAYRQGLQQAQCALERYHYLCAAIQREYDLPADFTQGGMFGYTDLSFSTYEPYALDPVLGVKLHPRPDGTIHPGDLKLYRKCFKLDWKVSEGGILYGIGDSRAFWNMILNYHSVAGTTGFKRWDNFFERLKANGFDKSIIPCMVRTFQYITLSIRKLIHMVVFCTRCWMS